jgi:hypothetical protein
MLTTLPPLRVMVKVRWPRCKRLLGVWSVDCAVLSALLIGVLAGYANFDRGLGRIWLGPACAGGVRFGRIRLGAACAA